MVNFGAGGTLDERDENFEKDVEAFRQAREKFSWLVIVWDPNRPRRRFHLIDGRNIMIHLEDLLPGRGTLRLLKQEDIVRLAFFVPCSVR